MILKPEPGSLDWHASIVVHGWDPNSGDDAPVSFGELTRDISDYEKRFGALIETIRNSKSCFLLNPMNNISEPDVFPEVLNPIIDPMVVIDPASQEETGLFPKAALWQSGWTNAKPYVVTRKQVYEKLRAVVVRLRTFDPDLCICVTDAWRSVEQQKTLFDAFYPNGYRQGDLIYVSEPHIDDRFAAPHPSGGAVDVLIGVKGTPIRIGADLDYMDVQANTDHYESMDIPLVRDMRRIFINLFSEQGFACIDSEYWHVEYGTRRWAGKNSTEPLYGNAVVEDSLFDGIKPVEPVPRSVRAWLFSKQPDPGHL